MSRKIIILIVVFTLVSALVVLIYSLGPTNPEKKNDPDPTATVAPSHTTSPQENSKAVSFTLSHHSLSDIAVRTVSFETATEANVSDTLFENIGGKKVTLNGTSLTFTIADTDLETTFNSYEKVKGTDLYRINKGGVIHYSDRISTDAKCREGSSLPLSAPCGYITVNNVNVTCEGDVLICDSIVRTLVISEYTTSPRAVLPGILYWIWSFSAVPAAVRLHPHP
ncbi:MAG: hypothetical protein TR69_WS6001000721 [candidate division WS6 bacterium OLB20]|uniref:Uncharacterized protein n=1 Tax=candidate division WS6 bacterium OLB20 TaxID=1617426 RepID=A0A136LYN5_9BACT|nr:MAG: hypothetical protein TR69_WS6001000721 [candidate division WS6 bacterium OLB20]